MGDLEITSKTEQAQRGPKSKTEPPAKSRPRRKPAPFHGVAIPRQHLIKDQTTHGYVVKFPSPDQTVVAEVHRTTRPKPGRAARGYVVTELEPGQTAIAYVVDKRAPGQPLFGFVFPKKGKVSYEVPTKAGVVKLRFKKSALPYASASLTNARKVLEMLTTPHPDLVTLRLEIAGDWTARDFAKAYGAIDRMYAALYHMQLNRPPVSRFSLYTVPAVEVDSVQYASPGDINLTGLGEPLKEIRESVKDMAGRHKRELQAQDAENALLTQEYRHNEKNHELSVMAQQIAIVNSWCETMRDNGLPENEIQDFIRRSMGSSLTDLRQLASEGKILDADTTLALDDGGRSERALDGALELKANDQELDN